MPKPKDEDRVLLKTLVDELDRASSEEDKKACSSTLSKYLNAAPKFIKSGVTQIGSVYKPQFVYEDVSLAKEEEKKNKQETDELLSDKKRKANIDEFLDELSNQTTPKKTKRNSDTTGYLKITNLSIGISEPNLKKEFSKFGRINNCYIEPSSGADSVTCFLEFRKTYDAECAMHALQKKKICGQSQNIQIQWCSNEEIDDLQKRFQKHFDENTKSDFVKMVSDLDTRRNTIMNVMGFCLDYQNNAEDITELFMKNIFSTVAKKPLLSPKS
ncbi:hypothetical protein C9374_004129 [Naegleria lovaniensis]|uniref:RRM domain-containing protein n=1 Tax=Naegleria lovaniensis TaxID=51637 RepID=A0AA88GSQ0_NAELO|nr:uncharacterized protein C9374_004129 [Naegleria lovaniensis]KAG2383458.1 hypothetical protein C9374_004129 [Naegleria lovaniensis]